MPKPSFHYHFIGIGGAGMAPMAMILREKGCSVSGSDISESENLDILRENGVKVLCGTHKSSNLPLKNKIIVIVSSAVSDDNPELLSAKKKALKIFRRGEFLAEIAKSYPVSIAVGGSHGKTSITGMIAHSLKKLGLNPGYMIGGKISGWKQNGSAGGRFFVTESDESDGTNIFMKAKIAVICNIDDDHEWNFKGGKEELFANFAAFAHNSDSLIYGKSPEADKLFAPHKNRISIGYEDIAQLTAELYRLPDFQKINALLAANAVHTAAEVKIDEALKTLLDFPGVERRINIKSETKKITLIEDYAHHPTELAALMSYLAKIKNGRNIHIVFQPHRYARLKKYFNKFAEELCRADKVTLLPVFSAWCPDNELNSQTLCGELNKKRESGFANFAEDNFALLAEKILKGSGDKTIIAVVGAGDCDKLTIEIKKLLENTNGLISKN